MLLYILPRAGIKLRTKQKGNAIDLNDLNMPKSHFYHTGLHKKTTMMSDNGVKLKFRREMIWLCL